jgi:(4S)-4-hydroxy-5-phosphonooxypentane-2,3-dione isomerase
MSDSVFFIVELEVKPGQIDALRSVMREMADLTRSGEPGTLNYEWFVTEDGTACHIYERYADSAAAVVHSATFPAELGQRAQAFRPTRLTAYGMMTEEIKEKRIKPLLAALPGLPIVYLDPLGGFAR